MRSALTTPHLLGFSWVTWLLGTALAAAQLIVTEDTYTHDKASAAAFRVENRFYRALVVPDMGGRIVEWIDKTAQRNVVYDNKYGGLLDDHGALYLKPYGATWLKREPEEAIIALELNEPPLLYRKTVHFLADRPVLQVEYHLENGGQDPQRLLFRNVVRPGGTEFSDQEIHCYSRVTGLQRVRGMPRTDDQADPWCALVHQADRVSIATTFEGDVLERLYTWQGSTVAPTYEFMFKQLAAGRQVDLRHYWVLCHGLSAVDYAHKSFVMQVEGELLDGTLALQVDLVATWVPLPDLRISGQILDLSRQTVLADIPPTPLPADAVDRVVRLRHEARLAGAAPAAIVLLKLHSAQVPAEIVIEKPFAPAGNDKLLTGTTRPVRWLGPHVEQKAIPGWTKEEKYVIRSTTADRERGYMLFEETGEKSGTHIEDLNLDLAQNEPEGLLLHFHSLTANGRVEMSVEVPAGIELDTFVPEPVPEKLWGRTRYGLKLNPGTGFVTKPGEDRALFFRLATAEPEPGDYTVRLRFAVQDVPATVLTVRVRVHPVRLPSHPYTVFDVNNVVNYLCAKRETKWKYAWDETRARNYLRDMQAHGVTGQTMVGVNAPNAHYAYGLVKERASGLPLPDAIKAAPERFRSVDPPHLDFSYWDWLIDRMLEHGMTRVKWPMGGCGSRFMQGHSKLTKMIYGRTFPDGDVRQLLVQEWYMRELVRHLKDKGIARVLCTIDDEIPSEKLAWWCQHAYRCLQMGLEPGVTQSARTIASDTLINFIAPYMRYWIIGTLHKPAIDLRRNQHVIKPEHWVTTYHSSANHWRDYDEMRRHCGIRNAFFDLDACWIQVYWRWRQSEAVIYPGEEGPTSSAAWEGARDGYDDANLYLLAKTMMRALPDEGRRDAFAQRLDALVGMREDSLVRFVDKMSSVGTVTAIDPHPDTARFRQLKRALFTLIGDMMPTVPVQKANVQHGLVPLIAAGKSAFTLPAGMKSIAQVQDFLRSAAGVLAFAVPEPAAVPHDAPYPVLFCGTHADLRELLPTLVEHADLHDLSERYPLPGSYVIRYLREPEAKPADEPSRTSLVVIGGDNAGWHKALANLSAVLTTPKTQYSHWLPAHHTVRARMVED